MYTGDNFSEGTFSKPRLHCSSWISSIVILHSFYKHRSSLVRDILETDLK